MARTWLTIRIELLGGGAPTSGWTDAVHDQDVADAWQRFSDDRGVGRARAYLADRGLRAQPRDVIRTEQGVTPSV